MKKLLFYFIVLASITLFLTCTIGDFSDTEGFSIYIDRQNNYINYSGNGATSGSVPVDSKRYAEGDAITVAGITPSLRGPFIQPVVPITQVFIGWNLSPEGTADWYYPGESIEYQGFPINLYAQWTDDTFILGKVGPAGGHVFVDKGTGDNGWQYMEAAPIAAEMYGLVWQTGIGFTGADGYGIGDGKRNTFTASEQLYKNGETGKTSQICRNLVFNGYSDWFVPSYEEFHDIFVELYGEGIGGFSSFNYTTSTEINDVNLNYAELLFDLTMFTDLKSRADTLTRPVRAFRSASPLYLIIYQPNEADTGTAPIDPWHYEHGEAANIEPAGTLGKSGETFTGWNTKAEGFGQFYSPGTNIIISSDLMLYAQWALPLNNTITYNGNGHTQGLPPVDGEEYLEGSTIFISANTMDKLQDGISILFTGWNTEPDGSGIPYQPETTYSMPGENLVLYAQWSDSVIGGTGPAGGIVFYDHEFYTGTPEWRYMEVRTDDIINFPWSNITDIAVGPGAQGTAAGTGLDNTLAIEGQAGHTASAAYYCLNRTTGGFSDWFLPSLDELLAVYTNLQDTGLVSFPITPDSIYFSSSEVDGVNVRSLDFGDGSIQTLQKVSDRKVLPVRRF